MDMEKQMQLIRAGNFKENNTQFFGVIILGDAITGRCQRELSL